MVSRTHPWFQKIRATSDHNKFVGKWLTSLDGPDLSNPAMAIQNGWQAEHMQNMWYAEELKEDMNIFAFDTRGTGESPKQGELNATQLAIDANRIIGDAFDILEDRASQQGVIPGNKILQGNCIGTMPIAALFAAKLPLYRRINGLVLISPVSTLSLPKIMKLGYFLPVWSVRFAIKHLAEPVSNFVVPGEESEESRREAMKRARKLIPEIAVKQVRQVFWKENVANYWKYISVPSLILVSRNDPLVKIEDSFDPFNKLKYPIWYELKSPDHLLLEGNISLLKKILPEFSRDPWNFYENHKDLQPDSNPV